MIVQQIDEMIQVLHDELVRRKPEEGIWRGRLSSSAISTAVAVFALYTIDKEQYATYIAGGVAWLKSTMKEDGSWGDTVESRSNMTATLLTYASLYAVDTPPEQTEVYLKEKFGGSTNRHIIKGVLNYYGTDLTFSAPILVMCALAGVISSWDDIPQLPFEASVLPQRMFRFLRLPVVSYAIPALIAVGILRFKKGKKNIFSPIRRLFIGQSLKTLTRLQPENGGYLEAAPLTAFVSMCMAEAGYREHITTKKAAGFLTGNVREDGAWPIDTDLANWVTALSVRALGDETPGKEALAAAIKNNAYKEKHPFTGAKEGGWGWTNLPGAAPDADDTAGALVALHILCNGEYSEEVGKGIEWLLDLQNKDGGIPTFCKGWGKLPFDRSSPDITAHTILAFELWMEQLPGKLKIKAEKSYQKMLEWIQKVQYLDGAVIPLWFGDQDARNEKSPVYGTAMTIEYLAYSEHPIAQQIVGDGLLFLSRCRNEDGGYGSYKSFNGQTSSKITLTARALSALATIKFRFLMPNFIYTLIDSDMMYYIEFDMKNAFDFLYLKYKNGELYTPEPIGLYFSRLWYSEELYNITFVLNALKKYKNILPLLEQH